MKSFMKSVVVVVVCASVQSVRAGDSRALVVAASLDRPSAAIVLGSPRSAAIRSSSPVRTKVECKGFEAVKYTSEETINRLMKDNEAFSKQLAELTDRLKRVEGTLAYADNQRRNARHA